ncbi:MAG: transposase [Terriglobales bacterium]
MVTENYTKIILKYVKKLVPNVRKPKYSSEYYLTNILNILTDFVSWKSLTKSDYLDKDNKYHYKTIADVHRLWCQKGVYKGAFDEIVSKKIKDMPENISETFQTLIDATLIINKNGCDGVGFCNESKKKKFTKLTALTTGPGEILNIVPANAYTKEITFTHGVNKQDHNGGGIRNKCKVLQEKLKNTEKQFKTTQKQLKNIQVGKATKTKQSCQTKKNHKIQNEFLLADEEVQKMPADQIIKNPVALEINEENKTATVAKTHSKVLKIKTLEHDVKGILQVCSDVHIPKNYKIEIVGDKGYIVNELEKEKLLNNNNITLITPYRRNQTKKNTPEEIKKLRQRGAVERMFARLKNYNRVHVRRDRNLVNYMGFVYLAALKISK